jgi:HK97 family phage prohead protease
MLQRAYSLLHVKAVDGDKRLITGMATTPTPDRMGDVVEPLGVQFKNPLPLLLYHDSKKPVGWVKFQKPTKDGIAFEASLPSIDEPGTVRDRIEEAWVSVKNKLIGGVSIGFRSLEEAFNKETNGFRFLKTEVLELSLVAIPANADARIDTIKSLDIGRPVLSDGPLMFFAQPSPLLSVKESIPPDLEFARMVLCKAASYLGDAEGQLRHPAADRQALPERGADPQLPQAKTAVVGGTTTDSNYASALLAQAQVLESAFLDFSVRGPSSASSAPTGSRRSGACPST